MKVLDAVFRSCHSTIIVPRMTSESLPLEQRLVSTLSYFFLRRGKMAAIRIQKKFA